MRPVDRFWTRVKQVGECWEWLGTKSTKGYGVFKIDGKCHRASRWIYQQYHGITLPKHLLVCHHCDNPSCVRISHLYAGTSRQNTMDGVRRGRIKTPFRKLTQAKVDEIRLRFFRIETHRRAGPRSNANELALEFGVKANTIRDIVKGLYWSMPADAVSRLRNRPNSAPDGIGATEVAE